MKRTTSIFTLITFLAFGIACSQNNSNKPVASQQASLPAENNPPDTTYFPFVISEDGDQFSISAATESPELYPKYANFFEKHGYSGNGYCWQGHITQILEKLNPELLTHIDFDPEAGGFYAYADTKENQVKFVELLSPIFSDLAKLETFVKAADRSRVDD